MGGNNWKPFISVCNINFVFTINQRLNCRNVTNKTTVSHFKHMSFIGEIMLLEMTQHLHFVSCPVM